MITIAGIGVVDAVVTGHLGAVVVKLTPANQHALNLLSDVHARREPVEVVTPIGRALMVLSHFTTWASTGAVTAYFTRLEIV